MINEVMKKLNRKKITDYSQLVGCNKKWIMAILLLWITTGFSIIMAQSKTYIKGTVTDSKNEPVIGATVKVKSEKSTGVVTDLYGHFSIAVTNTNQKLVISYLGMKTQEVLIGDKTNIKVVLEDDNKQLNEVVVVGFGQQKKESVVGAITQTTGKVLERTGGVSNVGAALTGNLPGVITVASTGMPGEEDPQIYVRAISTWNNSAPLILVDGVERTIAGLDINSVEAVSVLKDASATAVFGVKGANGVVLITTKRGSEGKAKIDIGFNSVLKSPSKLPGKYDSYDALSIRNRVVEYELARNSGAWNYITPQSVIEKYRYPANQQEKERYPNIDWEDALFKDYAMSYNTNINISGGTKNVRYFTALDYVHEGDLFEQWNTGRGYNAGYGYDRVNVRSNLDFNLTKTTVFRTNLYGSYGVKKSPWGATGNEYTMWQGAYNVAPDVFYPQYSDGTWGYYPADEVAAANSARNLALSGVEQTTTTRINTDFILRQDLSFITRGLKAEGNLSLDNTFIENGRGVNDLYHDSQLKWINPITGAVTYKTSYNTTTNFDFQEGVLWNYASGSMNNGATIRNLNYQLQLSYDRSFGNHNVAAMGLFKRNQYATGSAIPSHREDWVFRTTYNYNRKYFAEYNGAYNGTDQFSPENRFAFFSSGAVGWLITEENFMKNLKSIDMLKLRLSVGEIGNDRIWANSSSYPYMTLWSYGGSTNMGPNNEASPYVWYRQSSVGNPSVQWEIVNKKNIGLDYSFFNGLIAGSLDYFKDHRTNVLVTGGNRAVPSYYGTTAPPVNFGEVEASGFELEMRLSKMVTKNLRLWANTSITHAQNKIIDADDPDLLPDYQKKAGKQINQSYSYVSNGRFNNWDDLYGSTAFNENDNQKIPGNYSIVDYNGDGVINSFDNIPYGYSSTPQNTYNATLGFDWKGFSAFVQLYGVNDVTRQVVFTSFSGKLNTVYHEGSYWSKENTDADSPLPRFVTTPGGYYSGNRYFFDGSYIRLKNMEVSYTFDSKWIKKMGVQSLRLYVNGNNLWVWSRMPDDRESNYAGTGWASQGAYPTVKRYNVGLKISL